MTKSFRNGVATFVLALAGLAAPLSGQTVSDGGAVPTTGLNLPANLSTFGVVEPNVRKATAIVNGEIITGTDVEQRLALIVLANGGKVEEEEKQRLRVQVLRNLIDETLQIQEAKANKIDIPASDIDQSFARVAQNFKRTPTQLSAYLRDAGSSDHSIRRQIEGEVAWSRLLRRKVEVNISDAEVNAIIERLNAAKGTTEYNVSEIYLSANSENQAEVEKNLNLIIEQLKQGKSFVAYARQFSEASTAPVGGDLGWIRPGQLPEALGTAVQQMQPGQLLGPIEVPGGYSILYLTDVRQVLVADPRDAVLVLRQLSLAFPAGMTADAAKAKATEFAAATRSMGGCGKAEAVAKSIGAEMIDNEVQARNLPPQLQSVLLGMQVGEATPPFGSQEEGVRVLVLCGRDDPQVSGGPNFDQIMAQLEEERMNHRAQRYLRDLRRDAVVDYR